MTSRQFHPKRTEPPADLWLNSLVAGGTSQSLPPSITAAGKGGKFATDGTVLPYPGNTFICHIDKASPEFDILRQLQGEIRKLPAASCFSFLPPESLHMTVFCGVSGNPLTTDGWPENVADDVSLADITDYFYKAAMTLNGFAGVTVRADHLKAGYSIHAEPADQESFDALWRMRDALRAVTGLSRDDHDGYQFHISFGYRIRHMPKSMAEEHITAVTALFAAAAPRLQAIRLGPVEFCTFENMHHFEPVAHLLPRR
ncbi:DUF1868 domain-containing protein [Martelella sp. HB161492]|uniref:DUF1868 domain-containing protein n=1 Tax=Martelella sp. HB161492 TaxID=2720726 RepID=UPI001591FEE8|nr:DUF1868 domain-containing protein [Martelella sp. HB161492]